MGDHATAVAGPTIPFADPELFHRPHPVLHDVRARDPVHWGDEMNAWVLLRYTEVRRALFDPRLSSTGMTRRIERFPAEEQLTLEELRRTVEQWMGLPAIKDHRRYSTLLRPRFTASAVGSMEPEIRRRADGLLDAMIDRGGGDILEDFAAPYAIDVVSQLCGLPRAESMAGTLAHWARTLAAVFHVSDLDGLRSAQRAAQEMTAYLRELLAARRRAPRDDLVSLFLSGGCGRIRRAAPARWTRSRASTGRSSSRRAWRARTWRWARGGWQPATSCCCAWPRRTAIRPSSSTRTSSRSRARRTRMIR